MKIKKMNTYKKRRHSFINGQESRSNVILNGIKIILLLGLLLFICECTSKRNKLIQGDWISLDETQFISFKGDSIAVMNIDEEPVCFKYSLSSKSQVKIYSNVDSTVIDSFFIKLDKKKNNLKLHQINKLDTVVKFFSRYKKTNTLLDTISLKQRFLSQKISLDSNEYLFFADNKFYSLNDNLLGNYKFIKFYGNYFIMLETYYKLSHYKIINNRDSLISLCYSRGDNKLKNKYSVIKISSKKDRIVSKINSRNFIGTWLFEFKCPIPPPESFITYENSKKYYDLKFEFLNNDSVFLYQGYKKELLTWALHRSGRYIVLSKQGRNDAVGYIYLNSISKIKLNINCFYFFEINNNISLDKIN